MNQTQGVKGYFALTTDRRESIQSCVVVSVYARAKSVERAGEEREMQRATRREREEDGSTDLPYSCLPEITRVSRDFPLDHRGILLPASSISNGDEKGS